MLKLYIDTNIYIDYFDGRVDRLRPLGEFAFNVLKRTFECEFIIIISSVVINELDFTGYKEKIEDLIVELKKYKKLIYAEESENDEIKARKLKTSLNDAKHAVIANRAEADYLVTRNVKDFVNLQHLIKLKYPENL